MPPDPPRKSVLRTLIIKILFKKKLVSVMHAALPYLCPSNYPTLATPLGGNHQVSNFREWERWQML